VWVYYLIFVIVSGEGRGSVDACGRLGALLPSLRAFISVLPRLSAAHVFSLLNELLSHVFHLSSNKHHNIMITTNTTPHHRHHHHHHPPVLLLTRITRCVCLQCFVIIAVVVSGAFAFRLWEQYLLYALPCHPTRFSETSHARTYHPSPSLWLTSTTKQLKGNPLSRRCAWARSGGYG
jgi:hypothetical protein